MFVGLVLLSIRIRTNEKVAASTGAKIQVATTSFKNKLFELLDPPKDSPASKPTMVMLRDIGTRIIAAITKINIDNSKAKTPNSVVAFGKSVLMDCFIVGPWISSPAEKPIAPKRIPKRLLNILEPIAGPTHADKLFPDTIIEAMKISNTRSTFDNIMKFFT